MCRHEGVVVSGGGPYAVPLHVLEDLLGLQGVIRWKIVATIEGHLSFTTPCK